MSRTRLALSLGCAALILLPPAASAAQCGPRDRVVGLLATTYAETRRSIGLAATNVVIEVFASESGSWSIIATTADGTSCLVASGQGYEAVTEDLPARGSPV